MRLIKLPSGLIVDLDKIAWISHGYSARTTFLHADFDENSENYLMLQDKDSIAFDNYLESRSDLFEAKLTK